MNFLELAKNRFSVRKYKSDPVKEEDLLYVLEAGRIAPSAVNYQPWHFLVLKEKENLEKLYGLYADCKIRVPKISIIIIPFSPNDPFVHSKTGLDGSL